MGGGFVGGWLLRTIRTLGLASCCFATRTGELELRRFIQATSLVTVHAHEPRLRLLVRATHCCLIGTDVRHRQECLCYF